MRVECISTGRVRLKRGTRGVRRYFADDWSDHTLPVNAFLIEHPAGLCLFDTGQAELAGKPGYFPRWYPFFRLARFELTAKDELAAQIDPASVRWIVLSHLHTDHVGGLGSFTHAEVLVSRVEWERAAGIPGRLRGYVPQYWPAELEPHLIDFSDGPAGPFAVSHDVAGDGSLSMVPLPGHTPGHAGLLVDRRVLLSGDAAHSAVEFAATAPDIATWCAGEGVRVLLSHDAEAATR